MKGLAIVPLAPPIARILAEARDEIVRRQRLMPNDQEWIARKVSPDDLQVVPGMSDRVT